jgi:hypothetical protein
VADHVLGAVVHLSPHIIIKLVVTWAREGGRKGGGGWVVVVVVCRTCLSVAAACVFAAPSIQYS